MENLDRVQTWTEDHNEPAQVIINTEWGAFGNGGCLDFLRTDVDHDIDESSINPGHQMLVNRSSKKWIERHTIRMVSILP